MKKSWLILGLALLAAFAFSQIAFAEEQYKKKTVIDFDEVLLEGELKKPAVTSFGERTEMKFDTMIKVRENFEKEMLKSVDVLK